MCTSEKSGVHFYLTVGKCELGGHGTPCPYKTHCEIQKGKHQKVSSPVGEVQTCRDTACRVRFVCLKQNGKTAFRGRNVFNEISLDTTLSDTAQPVSTDMSGDGAFSRNPLDNSTAICYDKCIENRVEEEEYPDSCRHREAPAGERSSGTPENTPRSGFPERTGQ